MPCKDESLLSQLKELVNQIDDNNRNGGCPKPCAPCPPCAPPCVPTHPLTGYTERCFPFAQVVMSCPPPIMLPTSPCPVKPLQLPCPPVCNDGPPMDPRYDRFANFYNNYNVIDGEYDDCNVDPRESNRGCGVTVDGKNPKCEQYKKKPQQQSCSDGCPTGFKPCEMELCPPPCCDPWGVWCATVQPCPAKPKVSRAKKNFYVPPAVCRRPCCKHWKGPDPCLYDAPCKAHCFNHPPGIKPSGKSC